ncbi:hypothetical protein EVG20_g7153 [Dentipellis fragilis]|uniref:HAT C-terminal dimerisation domain-containing protein n=1 Tax=Dentipellis fragilis TaxID=205917 RepID=A0A4Y9YFP2_9AGAM|nr:hypothetical protein EVG20_g7153 [Dentipellis fragilis]
MRHLRATYQAANISVAREKIVKPFLRDGSITAAFERSKKGKVTYSHRQHTKAETKAEIIRWVSESLRPFNIVSDRGFNCLMKTGRPGYYIPSPSTVSCDVKLVFARARNRIAKLLQEHDGDLNFVMDAWTSSNHHAFIALTIHLMFNGEPISILLDLVEVDESHSGLNLAQAFARVLEEFGISNKMLSVTCDNASANDVMTDELVELVDSFSGQVARMRCFAHVVNLVAKSLLCQFDVLKAKADAELTNAERELQQLAEDLNLEDLQTQREKAAAAVGEGDDFGEEDDDDHDLVDETREMPASERIELEKSILPVKLVLLRKISFKIIHSTTILLPAWKAALKELNMPVHMMPCNVATRWNSTFDMLEFALKYQQAIRVVVGDARFELDKFELVANMPNLAVVIPAMDHIDQHFATETLNTKLNPAIHASISIAKRTLNHYYNLTDSSEVYRIAMILHPRHKLEYFKHANWEADWIDTAREIVRDEFDRSYASVAIPDNEAADDAESSAETTEIQSQNIFDNLPALRKPKVSSRLDELARYLAADVENVADGLQWWHRQCSEYPRLSRMAINYLSIPATSVAVERVFSRGHLLLSHTQNCLSAQTTRALLCLGDWSLLGLVKDEDVLKIAKMDDVEEGCKQVDESGEYQPEEGWDAIDMSPVRPVSDPYQYPHIYLYPPNGYGYFVGMANVNRSPNPWSRKKCEMIRDTGLSGMPLPKVRYNAECICMEDWSSFTPFFLKALQLASAELGVDQQTDADEALREWVAALEQNVLEAMTEPPSPKEKFAAYTPRPAQTEMKIHMTHKQTQMQQATLSAGDPPSPGDEEASQDPVTPTPGGSFGQQLSLMPSTDKGKGCMQGLPTVRSGNTPGSSYLWPAASPRGPRLAHQGPRLGPFAPNTGEHQPNPPPPTVSSGESQCSTSPDTSVPSPWSDSAPIPPPSSASSQPDDNEGSASDSGAQPGLEETEPSSSVSHSPAPAVDRPVVNQCQRPRKQQATHVHHL